MKRSAILRVLSTRLKTYGDRAFTSVAPRLCNSLPAILRNTDDLEKFSAGLIKHTFSSKYLINMMTVWGVKCFECKRTC